MSDLKNKLISVKELAKLSDYLENQPAKEEVIEILNFKKEDVAAAEKKGFFFMPNKITYMRRTDTRENIIEQFNKNKRKKVKKAEKFIEENKIAIITEEKVTQLNYMEWFSSIYTKNIQEKEKGIPSATENWWNEELDECKKVAVYAKKEGKIIAGIVARSYKKDEQFEERLSISYSGVLAEYKNSGINEFLNVVIIDFAKKLSYEWISRGKDTNIYGKHLSAGIPVFKTSLNYEILSKGPDMLIKFNNMDEFNDVVFFVSHGIKKLVGNLILKTDINIEEYAFSFLEKLNVFSFIDGKIVLQKEVKID